MLSKRYGHLVPQLAAEAIAKLQTALIVFEEADPASAPAIVDELADGDAREAEPRVWLSDLAVDPANVAPSSLVSSSAGP